MATKKARLVKLSDLAGVIDAAVTANAGNARLQAGIIMGRTLTAAAAAKLDTKALAKSISAQVSASTPGFKLTPTVLADGGIITIGFIAREIPQK